MQCKVCDLLRLGPNAFSQEQQKQIEIVQYDLYLTIRTTISELADSLATETCGDKDEIEDYLYWVIL